MGFDAGFGARFDSGFNAELVVLLLRGMCWDGILLASASPGGDRSTTSMRVKGSSLVIFSAVIAAAAVFLCFLVS